MQRPTGRTLAETLYLPIAASVCAFSLDMSTPTGFADGFFYVVPVIACLRVRPPTAVFGVAAVMTLLIMFGTRALESSGLPGALHENNRLSCIALLWGIATILWMSSRFKALNREPPAPTARPPSIDKSA